jgi:hypothetical protein
MASEAVLPETLDYLRQMTPQAVNSKTADARQMVGDVERFIRRFMVLPDAAYLPVAIWVIGTHAVQRLTASPI